MTQDFRHTELKLVRPDLDSIVAPSRTIWGT